MSGVRQNLLDVCELIVDCEHKTAPTQETGYPSIRTPNIGRGRLILDGANRVSEETYRTWSRRAIPQAEDLILAREAPIGNVAIIPKNLNVCLGQRTVLIRPDKNKIIPMFLLYLMLGDEIQEKLLAHSTGTTVGHLNMRDIRNLKLPRLPQFSTQRKIAAILSAYDDLIENNTRRIKILEEMAATIYREWFVEFRFPGHEHVKMAESELGLIPEGWDTKFSDYVDFKEGPGLRRWQYRDEGIPFLNIRTLVDNDIDSSKLQYLDPDEVRTKYSHFLLSTYDHVVSSSGTLGRIVTIQRDHLPLMLNTSIIRMRAKTKNVGPWQLKHFLKSDYFQRQINALATGTAQKNYGPSHLKHMKIVAPDSALGRKYEELVSPLEELLGVLVIKNANLRSTRDLLLPKLISGELDVSTLDIGADLYRSQEGEKFYAT